MRRSVEWVAVCGVLSLVTLGQSTRAPIAAQSIRSENKVDLAVEQALNRRSAEILGRSEGYLYNRVDLNRDGRNDVLVYVWGRNVCGSSGCTLYILKSAGGERYDVISEMELVWPPVIVSGERTSGWSDLVTSVHGGGVAPGYWVHQFDGSTYDGGVRDDKKSQNVRGVAYMSDWGRNDAGVRR